MLEGKMTLGEVARVLDTQLPAGSDPNLTLSGLSASSENISAGCLFVAVRGTAHDGHAFVEQAKERGARAAVLEDSSAAAGLPAFIVRDTRLAVSKLASYLCAEPSREMLAVGVTGTNGKTTTHWLIYHALNELGYPCVRIGTLGVKSEGGIDLPGNLTTPDPILIQKTMRDALGRGGRSCVMETSSHALDQGRVNEIHFDAAIFTNLTRDHLDYHKTMESYFGAKYKLFELLARSVKASKAAVINVDTNAGKALRAQISSLKLNDYSFGKDEKARVRIASFRQSVSGSELELLFDGRSFSISSRFIGAHNAENLAGAFAALAGCGIDPAAAAEKLSLSPAVPGRLEPIGGSDVTVYVDYAHTPDALERALVCLRPITSGKLWVLFGCGGDRDRGKRPLMAAVAQRFADRIVVTSDNPRTEEPAGIIADILSGEAGADIRAKGIVEADRRRAIEKALLQAGRGDVILIAGKGHEDYQIIGREKLHFSDQEEARRVLSHLRP